MRVLALCFLVVGTAVTTQGCVATKGCTLLSCDSRLTVHVAQAPTAYSLGVSAPGFSATVACPTSSPEGVAMMQPDSGVTPDTLRIVRVGCTGTEFTLSWFGDHMLGTSALDAPQIVVDATLTPTSGTAAPIRGKAAATTTGTNAPNGASCGPTCYAREAVLGP